MGKFVLSGTIIGEPSKKQLGKEGLDCITIMVEEKVAFGKKENVEKFCVDFIGKNGNCIPTDIKLAGLPVVVYGYLCSKEYKGNYYTFIRGQDLTIITGKTYRDSVKEQKPTKQDIDEAKAPDIADKNEDVMANDDLPF